MERCTASFVLATSLNIFHKCAHKLAYINILLSAFRYLEIRIRQTLGSMAGSTIQATTIMFEFDDSLGTVVLQGAGWCPSGDHTSL